MHTSERRAATPCTSANLGLSSTDDVQILAHAHNDDRVVVSCDHDFVQMLFASGDTGPSLLLTSEVDTSMPAR